MAARKSIKIGMAAVCLGAGLVTIICWVRSYSWNDVYAIHVGAHRVAIQSLMGRVVVVRAQNTVSFHQRIATSQELGALVWADENVFGFHFQHVPYSRDLSLHVPHWWFVLLAGMLAVVPWIRWRFGLRTLLIVTALCGLSLKILIAYW